MFSNKDIENRDGNVHEQLKKDFLSGNISPEEIRDKLIALDQATSERDAADDNLAFLSDPEIIKYISEKYPKFIDGYNRFLSFTELHVAQRFAFAGNSEEAIRHFKNSLSAAEKGKSHPWNIAYIQGTLLYMEGKQIPEALISNCGGDRNEEILKNLNIGLQSRSYPSYKEDYSK